MRGNFEEGLGKILNRSKISTLKYKIFNLNNMKVLSWINMVIAGLFAVYMFAMLPDAYTADDRFGVIFGAIIFFLFGLQSAIYLFAKKQ